MPTPGAAVDPLAQAAVDANLSPRYRYLDLLERYVDGTQYEGRSPFFADDVPLFDRAPCIVVPMVEEAICSHAALVLGDDHFPSFTTHGDEDDAEEADPEEEGGLGLSREDSAALDRLIGKISKQTHLQPTSRQLLEAAMGCGTSVAICRVTAGRLAVDGVPAKWCTPTFGPDGEVVRLEIRYPYVRETKDAGGKTTVEALLYRRVIDDKADTVYLPAKASRNGAEPDYWQKDKSASVDHGLGFCPVLWYKHMANVATVGEIDGRALHRLCLQKLDALNFAVSQRHRATLTTLDPILAEIGVDENDPPPAPLVDQASSIFLTPEQQAGEAQNARWGQSGRARGVRKGRMRAPGMTWSYPGSKDEVEVKLITLPGDAMQAGTENAADIECKIAEALRWVPIDPKTLQISSALSGRAIEWLHKKQIEHCNEVRTDAGTHLLLPLLSLLLRMVLALAKRGGLYLAGVSKALPILERFLRAQKQTDGTTRSVWMSPEIDLSWPPYFQPTDADQFAEGNDIRADLGAKIITRRTAVEMRARRYGIANVEQYIATLEGADKPPPGAPGQPEGGADAPNAPPGEQPAAPGAPAKPTDPGAAPTGEAPPDSDAGPVSSESSPSSGLRLSHANPLRHIALGPEILARIQVRKLGRAGDHDVCVVDGAYIRNSRLDVDFVEGGNPGRYAYIPAGAIWIEKFVAEDMGDLAGTVLHELVEEALMLTGACYNHAHELAKGAESRIRDAIRDGLIEPASPEEALAAVEKRLPDEVRAASARLKPSAPAAPAAPAPSQPAKPGDDEPAPDTQRSRP